MRYPNRIIGVGLLLGLLAVGAPAAWSAPEVFWCPMRGNPCATKDYPAAGKCPDCGMDLITQAAYEEYQAALAERDKSGKKIGIVLYPGFEALDVYGPVEMLGSLTQVKLVMVAEKAGPVDSFQGVKTIADFSFEDCPKLDILLVPGGMGTLMQLNNEKMLEFLRAQHKQVGITTSVCSGSWLLAKAGILDGRKATSNKLYFEEARKQSDKVEWIESARWVDDGNIITSSGVSAGMDMALHLVARLFGEAEAKKVAGWTEYRWNSDPNDDPFAKGVAGVPSK